MTDLNNMTDPNNLSNMHVLAVLLQHLGGVTQITLGDLETVHAEPVVQSHTRQGVLYLRLVPAAEVQELAEEIAAAAAMAEIPVYLDWQKVARYVLQHFTRNPPAP